MKAFFEEYGFVLVSICAVAMLLTMVPIVGNSVGDQLVGTVNGTTLTLPDDLSYTSGSSDTD